MAIPELPLEGGCRCGKVRFGISEMPMLAGLCHCRGCQKMTASAFSTTLTVPSGGFAVTQGDTVIGGIHGAQGHHHHCDYCKSWIFTTVEPDIGFVNVRATLLDDAAWFVPFVETQTAEALPWAIAGAPESFERFPEVPDYLRLTTAYAQWQAD